MIAGNDTAGELGIESRLVAFPGSGGMQIVGYIDQGPESSWNGRVVVLAPRYGETKKNSLQLAYALVANGFKVLRFDQTNHIGESDGTMDRFTLSGASGDILSAVAYVDRCFEPAEIILISLSLSCRSGFRACAQEPRISRFISLVGMVDMDKTLQAIYQRDFFGELSAGAEWRMVDILGFEIDGKHFHDDLVDTNMKCLKGTLEDAAKVTVPVLHLFSERDLWVAREDVERVIQQCPNGRLVMLSEVGHEINENPKALQAAIGEMIQFCMDGLPGGEDPILLPDKQELLRQNKIERERLQKVMRFADSESDFWGDYLGKFGIIEGAHYYIEYFRKMAELLGGVRGRDVILDAGCGNGFYGVNIVRSLCFEAGVDRDVSQPVHYCGVDLTKDGLFRSYSRHVEELIELHREYLSEAGRMSFSYRKIDFDRIGASREKHLPFADASVSKVCCSLVLSYLQEPLELMREFHRVLKPGGVAVVSSMKPGCDMTVLYHDYVVKDDPSERKDREANSLLSAAGKIKLKKDTGVYHFFSEEELECLALGSGFTDIRSCRSFGNQANVVRIVK